MHYAFMYHNVSSQNFMILVYWEHEIRMYVTQTSNPKSWYSTQEHKTPNTETIFSKWTFLTCPSPYPLPPLPDYVIHYKHTDSSPIHGHLFKMASMNMSPWPIYLLSVSYHPVSHKCKHLYQTRWLLDDTYVSIRLCCYHWHESMWKQ